jgi:hypothetical protein
MKKNNKLINNKVVINNYSVLGLFECWKISNLNQLTQYKERYPKDKMMQLTFDYNIKAISLLNDSLPSLNREPTRIYLLKNILRNKIINLKLIDTIYVLERHIKGEPNQNFSYMEFPNTNNSVYYQLEQVHLRYDSIKIANAPKGCLRDLFYLSKEIQNYKIDQNFKQYRGDGGDFTITMFTKKKLDFQYNYLLQ